MSTKLMATEIKVKDFIESATHKIKGIVDYIQVTKDRVYVDVFTEQGRRSLYLQLTDEVIKDLAPADWAIKMNIEKVRNLGKTIDKIGSDPEMFVVDKNNEVIPSYHFLKSKEEGDVTEKAPIEAYHYHTSYGQNIFWDGFQAEFNLCAESCLSWVCDSVYHGLSALSKRAKQHNKDARLTIQPTMDIQPHYLRNDEDKFVQFGCMPSKNVYNMEGIKADGRDVPFRSAGGHIHFGLSETQKGKIEDYVKALDAILGVACVSLFGSYDDVRRREYYGLAGEYRTPKHGLEYRTLSNVWMCHPVVMNIVFELSRKVISMVDANLFKSMWKADEEEILEAINNCNIPLACEILTRNEEVFKALLASFTRYMTNKETDAIYNAFMFGVENLIENPDDVEGNWNIGKGVWVGHCDGAAKKIGNMKDLPLYKELLKTKV